MREKQINEALTRMKLLHLSERCIQAFKEGDVWESEGMGALYELNDKEKAIVNDFEKEHNAIVYHMIHNRFEFGECYSLLYVSKDEGEWKSDKEDISEGYIFSYVVNIDFPYCSEFGCVAIKSAFGGLVRLG